MTVGLSQTVEQGISRTVAAIYDAAVAPELWPEALRHIRDQFRTGSTAYIVHNADRTRINRIAAETDPDGHEANVNTLLRGSIAYTRGPKACPGEIVPVWELVPSRIFQRSRMYQEYWRPRDLHDGLRLTIAVGAGGTHHVINLIRSRSLPVFQESDIALARFLMPQLQRAVAVRQRLREVDMLASAALSALDILRHAVLLLDQNGRVLHANASGEVLLREADVLGARHGVLFGATQGLTKRLHAVLARAAGLGGLPAQAGVLRLSRRLAGDEMFALLAMPFRQDTCWSQVRRPSVLVCVTDPGAGFTVPGEQLTELFGLTGAEAALAAGLLAGQELRRIAETSGRSVNTVRTHLAKLMAKTNVNRQSDLMRLLAGLPRPQDVSV